MLSAAGALTVFLSPATASRAGARVRMDSLADILETLRKCILQEAEILTANPAPLAVMLGILVLGAVVLRRERGWKCPGAVAVIGGIALLAGWVSGEGVRVAGFSAAFIAPAVMAVLLMAGGRSFTGGLTLTGLAAAAVMLPTNTVAPRVLLPVYLLLLVSVCLLAAQTLRHRTVVAVAGLVLAVVVSIPAVAGYWNNYQVDRMNEEFAREARDGNTVRYCTDYDMDYTWIKADFDSYFRTKYLESIGMPKDSKVAFFSRFEETIPILYGDQTLAGSLRTEPDGTWMLPLREVIETMGGSLEWTADRRAVELDGVVLVLEPVGDSGFRVCPEGGGEFLVGWCTWSSVTYCDAALFEEGLGITLRMDPDSGCCYLEK